MKENDFDLITQCLLDELSPEERRLFERRLEKDEALRSAYRETEAAMVEFARLSAKEETASIQMWERIKKEVTEEPLTPSPAKGQRIGFSRMIWPIAAAVLIGLNLFQYTEQADLKRRWEALEAAYERKQTLVFERDEALDSLWSERNELRIENEVLEQQLTRLRTTGSTIERSGERPVLLARQ